MTQYYYIDEKNGRRRGPVSALELRNSGVTSSTHVWRHGMRDWQEAGRVRELSQLFQQHSAPVDVPRNRNDRQYSRNEGYVPRKPSDMFVWSVISVLLCTVTGLIALVYAIMANSFWEIHEYDGAERAAERSKMWCWISLGIFLFCCIVGIFLLVAWVKY
jgi:hypothetical protein